MHSEGRLEIKDLCCFLEEHASKEMQPVAWLSSDGNVVKTTEEEVYSIDLGGLCSPCYGGAAANGIEPQEDSPFYLQRNVIYDFVDHLCDIHIPPLAHIERKLDFFSTQATHIQIPTCVLQGGLFKDLEPKVMQAFEYVEQVSKRQIGIEKKLIKYFVRERENGEMTLRVHDNSFSFSFEYIEPLFFGKSWVKETLARLVYSAASVVFSQAASEEQYSDITNILNSRIGEDFFQPVLSGSDSCSDGMVSANSSNNGRFAFTISSENAETLIEMLDDDEQLALELLQIVLQPAACKNYFSRWAEFGIDSPV